MEAMSRGQLLLAGFILVLIIIVARMPSQDVSQLIFQLIDIMVALPLLGYALAGVFLCGWAIHIRKQGQMYEREISRITGMRDEAQRKLIGPDKIKSSED